MYFTLVILTSVKMVCVCLCVRPSVRLSTVFVSNRGMHGKVRFRRPGKLVKRTAAEVNVRKIEITDDRCTLMLCMCGEDLLVCQ